ELDRRVVEAGGGGVGRQQDAVGGACSVGERPTFEVSRRLDAGGLQSDYSRQRVLLDSRDRLQVQTFVGDGDERRGGVARPEVGGTGGDELHDADRAAPGVDGDVEPRLLEVAELLGDVHVSVAAEGRERGQVVD